MQIQRGGVGSRTSVSLRVLGLALAGASVAMGACVDDGHVLGSLDSAGSAGSPKHNQGSVLPSDSETSEGGGGSGGGLAPGGGVASDGATAEAGSPATQEGSAGSATEPEPEPEPELGAEGGAGPGPFRILVLSTTLDFPHDSRSDCQTMLSELGTTPDNLMPRGAKPGSQFAIDIANDDLSDFTDENLERYGMLFWCSPSGRVFSNGGVNGSVGMAAIQKFVESGGAWGGVHGATDFEKENGFPWFTNELTGASYSFHDSDLTTGIIQVEAAYANHPVMRGVPATWSTRDEWYIMDRDVSLQPGFQVLAKLTDGRPVIWTKELGPDHNGRMFYTTRGHNAVVYQEPAFKRLVLNGVLWATHRLE